MALKHHRVGSAEMYTTSDATGVYKTKVIYR